MYQLAMLLFTVILMIVFFYNLSYRSRKASEYKNDERWQTIELKSNRIATYYYQFVMVLIVICITMLLFIDSLNIDVSLSRTLNFGFYVIIIGQIIEMLALKYFDERM